MNIKTFVLVLLLLLTQGVIAKNKMGYKYDIVIRDDIPNLKKSIDVILSKRITKNELVSLAHKIGDADHKIYDALFISYILKKKSKEFAQVWANTNFTPNLKVEILGLTIDQVKFLKNFKFNQQGKVLGMWLREIPSVGDKLILFRKNKKTYFWSVYTDGSNESEELTKIKYKKKIIYKQKGNEERNEYYTINKKGDLELWADDEIYEVYDKIK